MSLFNSNHTFRGGIHPPEFKELSEDKAFEIFPNPELIILPLSQHIGKPAVPVIKKGDQVKAGMLVAQPEGFISAPIHSPVSGIVDKILMNASVSGFPKEAVIIKPAETNEIESMEILNIDTITPDQIRERVKSAGIVGQGGAAFPTFVKLSPPKDKVIDMVILNGCECEPYLTRDYRYMIERPDDVLNGLLLIMRALGIQKGAVGIENNKPKAYNILKERSKEYKGIEIYSLKTKYPQGAEKMLIKAVTGREVSPGRLPMDVGVVIQNIGTAVAISEAVTKGLPQLTAALTVTGRGIKATKNLIVPVGTPLQDVLNFCGGLTEDAVKVIVGGPMMGVAQYDFTAPIMKATSGILVLTKSEINKADETPCLRCGKCVDACPVNLIPTKLSRYSQLGKYEEVEALNVNVCMECGTCAYTCPANIPLVQWIKLGKQKVQQ